MSPAVGRIAVLRSNRARFAIASIQLDDSDKDLGVITLQGWVGPHVVSVRDYAIRYETVEASKAGL